MVTTHGFGAKRVGGLRLHRLGSNVAEGKLPLRPQSVLEVPSERTKESQDPSPR